MIGKRFTIVAMMFVSLNPGSLALCSTDGMKEKVSLEDCFAAALKRSEDLAGQEELILIAEEKYKQAKGAILPRIEGGFSYLYHPTPPGGLGATFSPPVQTTTKITLTQPLFRGFSEFATLRREKSLLEGKKIAQEQAMIQLYRDVVQNFYQILSLEKDINNLKTEISLNHKRLDELRDLTRIGRSRESEVLTFQSNLARLESQVEKAQGQLDIFRDIFVFLTGLASNTPIYDKTQIAPENRNLDYYISRIELRPDIRSLEKDVRASEEEIKIARGRHFPSIDLLGDYFFSRPGLLANVPWDVSVNLTIPLFQGGIIQSQVRQAALLQRRSQLALSKSRRLARQEIESFYHLYQSDLSQLNKQRKAVDLGIKNYEAELRDYQLGLVRNLDVLTALSASQEYQRDLDRTQFQMKTDFLKLESAAALLPQVTSLAAAPENSQENSQENL